LSCRDVLEQASSECVMSDSVPSGRRRRGISLGQQVAPGRRARSSVNMASLISSRDGGESGGQVCFRLSGCAGVLARLSAPPCVLGAFRFGMVEHATGTLARHKMSGQPDCNLRLSTYELIHPLHSGHQKSPFKLPHMLADGR